MSSPAARSPKRSGSKEPVQFSSPNRALLASHPCSPALHKAWASDAELDDPGRVNRNPRKTSASLRKQMRDRGAFFLRMEGVAEPDPLRGLEGPDVQSYTTHNVESKERKEDRRLLGKIFDKGVLVTKETGCIVPHPRYCTHGDGDKRKAHQRVMLAVHGVQTVPGSQGRYSDDHGWPSHAEVSHLCHRRQCCRPDHLILESAWRNRKRNYCGAEGECDCNQQPPCVAKYRASDKPVTDDELCGRAEQVERRLRHMFGRFKIRFTTPEEIDELDRVAADREAAAEKKSAAKAAKAAKGPRAAGVQKHRKTGAAHGIQRHRRLRAVKSEGQAYRAAKNAARRAARSVLLSLPRSGSQVEAHSAETIRVVEDAAEAAYLRHLNL